MTPASLKALLGFALCTSVTAICTPAGPNKVAPTVTRLVGPLFTDWKFADPSVLQAGNTFYIYSTGHASAKAGSNVTPGANLPYAYSNQLDSTTGWTATDNSGSKPVQLDAMPPNTPTTDVGNWTIDPTGSPMVGSPDVFERDGNYYALFAAKGSDSGPANGQTCLGLTKSSDPKGPFKAFKNAPYFCPRSSSAIDPGYVYDKETGQSWVHYKSPSCSIRQTNSSCVPKMWIFKAPPFETDSWPKDPDDVTELTRSSTEPGYSGEEGATMTRMRDCRWLMLHSEGTNYEDYRVVYAISPQYAIETPNYYDPHGKNGTTILGAQSEDGITYTTMNGTTVWKPGGPDILAQDKTKIVIAGTLNKEMDGNSRYIFYAELDYGIDPNPQ